MNRAGSWTGAPGAPESLGFPGLPGSSDGGSPVGSGALVGRSGGGPLSSGGVGSGSGVVGGLVDRVGLGGAEGTVDVGAEVGVGFGEGRSEDWEGDGVRDVPPVGGGVVDSVGDDTSSVGEEPSSEGVVPGSVGVELS